MKLLMENWKKFVKESLEDHEYTAYHCGKPDIEADFNFGFAGSGEGLSLLGPGLYFATKRDIAKNYCKYSKNAVMYKAQIPKDALYNPTTGLPLHLREKIASILAIIRNETGRDPYRGIDSFKHGKGSIGAVVKHYGPEEGRRVLIKNGILGAIEILPSQNGEEIALFDIDSISILPEDT